MTLLADATKRRVGATLGERRGAGSRSVSVGESVGFGGRIAKEQGEFFVRRIFLLDGDNRSVGVGGDRSDEGCVGTVKDVVIDVGRRERVRGSFEDVVDEEKRVEFGWGWCRKRVADGVGERIGRTACRHVRSRRKNIEKLRGVG